MHPVARKEKGQGILGGYPSTAEGVVWRAARRVGAATRLRREKHAEQRSGGDGRRIIKS
jgi:hypothetical protein